MTIVARKGKLSLASDASSDIAWQRIEDALTADVFGAYRYLPLDLGLIPFVRHACDEHRRTLSRYLQDRDVDLAKLRYARIVLWPTFEDGREPDALIALGNSPDDLKFALLVEAKLYSTQHEITDGHGVTRCQVAHYAIHHMRNRYATPADKHGLPQLRPTLYITRSTTCPDGELVRIRREVAAAYPDMSPQDFGIFWVSWVSAGREAVNLWRQHRDHIVDQPWLRLLLDLREELATRQLLPRPAFRGLRLLPDMPSTRIYSTQHYLRSWSRSLPPLQYTERSYRSFAPLGQLPARLYA